MLLYLSLLLIELLVGRAMAERRRVSARAMIIAFLAALSLGPVGMVLVLGLAKRNGRFPNTFEGRIAAIEKDMKDIEKAIESRNKALERMPSARKREKLNSELKSLREAYDSKVIEKAAVYNPAIRKCSSVMDAAVRINGFHDSNIREMKLDPKEKEERVRKIRENYIALCEKGTMEKHIGNLKL